MSYLITIPPRSIDCDSVRCKRSLPLLLTSSGVAEVIIHQTSSNFFRSLLDGCVNKNRLSILSYAIRSSFSLAMSILKEIITISICWQYSVSAVSTPIMDEKAKGIYVSCMVQESPDRRYSR